ncbi:MAG TPA: hypothetical protein VF765_29980 [Polyangiaceae bacterium]
MAIRDVVIDACCTLNLLATRREVEILGALEIRLFDTPKTAGEPMFLWSPPDQDGERTRELVTTVGLRQAGHLMTRALDTDALVDAFVAAAALIKDTDASCIAVAGTMRLPLITDDRKERRIATDLFPAIELVSTLDLLHDASRALRWNEDELARVAIALRWGGNFAPPRQDPRAAWYAALLRSG